MTMIVCPNCKHQELDGSLFCSECGAQLVFTTTNDDDNLAGGDEGANTPPKNQKPPNQQCLKPLPLGIVLL